MKDNNGKLSYFDLHCDTLTKLIEKKEFLRSNNTAQVSLERTSGYSRFSQVFAVFCPPGMDSSGSWKLLTDIIDAYSGELVSDARFTAYLSIENALTTIFRGSINWQSLAYVLSRLYGKE